MSAIVAIGIGLVDVYPQKNKMYPGGNEYNVCCYARELGARSSFIGVFAPDRAGRLIEEVLVQRGVDVSHSRHADGYTNYALIELRDGNRVFTDWSRTAVTDMHPVRFTPEDIAFIRGHDVACVSYASRLRREDVAQLSREGIPLSYDFSDSFTDEKVEQYCPLLKFAFFSCDHLTEEASEALLEKAVGLGCGVAVATRGKQGSMAYDGRNHFAQPALDVRVVDTMGAGDSFIAAFLNRWYSREEPTAAPDMPSAMRAAAAFASLVIQREGALGVGYDVTASRLMDTINYKMEGNT